MLFFKKLVTEMLGAFTKQNFNLTVVKLNLNHKSGMETFIQFSQDIHQGNYIKRCTKQITTS